VFGSLAVGASVVLGEEKAGNADSSRIVPISGYLLGGPATFDAAKQLAASDGVQPSMVRGSGEVALTIAPSAGKESSLTLTPASGRWDLRDGSEVRVLVKNGGSEPISPRCRLESDHGPTDTVSLAAPINPSTEAELIVPFAPAVPWQGIPNSGDRTSWNGQPRTGTKFTSDAASKLVLLFPSSPKAQSLVIRKIVLDAPPGAIPSWLGKRPPAAGEWVQTFDDEFTGTTLDTSKWNIVGPNYYDHQSRFVKENVIVGDGVARLRFEKREGRWANPADGGATHYASGYLDTYGKWTQRYGYFESRMKLPRSPGLWPAFWMMPDRGATFPGDRGSTANGGMEFDIMERLTRWGPYRYNIAMHWDGYEKNHKQTGSETIYVQPDAEGWITAGLLWTPGSAIYYCNGKEVLRWEDPRISSVPADMMFTLPCGGWDNNALDDAKLPGDLVIDYVRCWQRKDLAGK
jgi:beta-glucanase (GH16 family)